MGTGEWETSMCERNTNLLCLTPPAGARLATLRVSWQGIEPVIFFLHASTQSTELRQNYIKLFFSTKKYIYFHQILFF